MIYKNLDSLEENFRKKVEAFCYGSHDIVAEYNIPGIFITETWRSAERQNKLFYEGKTYIDGINNLSMHQRGLAIDIAFHGSELYPSNHEVWEKIARLANEHGIDWGYDLWSDTGYIDKPHFQDNGHVFVMPPSIPNWADPYVKRMKEKGIETSPIEKVGNLPLYQLMGIIDKYIS